MIYRDERYPDYGYSETGDGNVTVYKKRIERWKKVFKEYEKVQNELKELYDK